MITKITKSIFAALCLLQIPLEFATGILFFGMTYQILTTPRQITHSAARPTPSRGWHCSPQGDLTHRSEHHCHLERSDCVSDTQQLKPPAWNRSATAVGDDWYNLTVRPQTILICWQRHARQLLAEHGRAQRPAAPAPAQGSPQIPLPSSSLGSRVLGSVSDCLARHDL